jgi:hypothetical protein
MLFAIPEAAYELLDGLPLIATGAVVYAEPE